MVGPSWLVKKFVKDTCKENGMSAGVSTAVGITAGVVSSMVFHDHHSHFVPVPDDVSDAAEAINDIAASTGDAADASDAAETINSMTESAGDAADASNGHHVVSETMRFGSVSDGTDPDYYVSQAQPGVYDTGNILEKTKDMYHGQNPMHPGMTSNSKSVEDFIDSQTSDWGEKYRTLAELAKHSLDSEIG